ncbi:MAG TPA: SDR family oxidoreductase [Candidatus Limnocylindria bacterium]|nr:SDR family oxidoreductase [Candidatus Limnocylindria bacterium]
MAGSNGRVVVITGASGKLGTVVAARFAKTGVRLALIARSADEVEALAAELPGGSERHLGLAVDLGSADETVSAAATIRARLDPVSVLLHLVGGYAGGTPFAETDDAGWSHLLDLNLWSTIHAVRAFLPDIAAAPDGRIVTVSTFVAAAPTPKHAAYAASKAAVEALTISVARDLAGTTATANVVVLRSIGDEKPTDQRPEEIAAAMAWLCTPEAGTVNGQRIPLIGRA